jgi:Domain of Unknown Function (DUF928)
VRPGTRAERNDLSVSMMHINLRLLKIAAAAFALLGITCATLPSLATRYRPPQNIQRPEGRQGGATRSGCMTDNFAFEPILPISNYGQTIAKHPTIYWYLKNHKFSWARIDLYASQNPAPEAVPQYSKTIKLSPEQPLNSFTFNEESKTLEVGQEYLWKVTLLCSALGADDDSADGSQVSIQGSITRTVISASFQDKIARTNHPYDAYAEEGFWYDAIHDLALQRQEQPQNSQLSRDWCDLLKETRLGAKACE